MPMTYNNTINAANNAETSEKKGSLSKALSFLNRKAASSRSAGGKLSAKVSSSVQAYEELHSEHPSYSNRSHSISSRYQSVNSVLHVLAASQDSLAEVTTPSSPTASREGVFFSRSNSITSPQGAAAGRDSRSSLLSRLLKVRSSTDNKQQPAVGTADYQSLSPSPSPTKADAFGTPQSAPPHPEAAAAAGAVATPPLTRSNSSSMLQQQSSMERKRSRFGQQDAQFLSWSMDAANMPSLTCNTSAPDIRTAGVPGKESLTQQLHQRVSDATASPGGSVGGAECYVFAKLPAADYTAGDDKAAAAAAAAAVRSSGLNSPRSPRSPCWRNNNQPWSPRRSPTRNQHDSADSNPGSAGSSGAGAGRRSPRKSAVSTVPVHELAAAFEKRCGAQSPTSAGFSEFSGGQKASPRRSKTPEGLSTSLTGSPRLSHFNVQQQQQHQQKNAGSSSSRNSPSPKPSSPFYSMGHQKQLVSAFEGPSSHQHSAGTSPAASGGGSKQQGRVPALSWAPKASPVAVTTACGPVSSSSSSLPVTWEGSSHSSHSLAAQNSQQQQQQQAETGSTSPGSTSGGALQGCPSSSSTASSSRGGSPFKPKPPQMGASPQRLRPGMVIRQTFSAPIATAAAAAQKGATAAHLASQGSAASLAAEPSTDQPLSSVSSAAAVAAATAAGYTPPRESAAAAAAAAGVEDSKAASTAAEAASAGLDAAVPLMPLTRNRPQPAPCTAEIPLTPRAAVHAVTPDAATAVRAMANTANSNTPGVMAASPGSPKAAGSTPRSSPVLLAGAAAADERSGRLTPRVNTPRSRAAGMAGTAGVTGTSSSYHPPAPHAAAAGVQQAGELQALQALQEQQQQVQAMQQQLKLQQSSPQLPVRTPGMPQQQQCVPIAIARHCPQDLQGPTWQPRDFIQTKKLYEGKIAAVVQGYHAASGRPLALKVYNRARLDTMERFQLAREVCLHMRSCHPSITALYAAYKDARYIYLLMELAPSGNLYQMLMAMPVPPGRPRCLPERDAVVRVIKPLLAALGYLHEQGIIHRDIKLENVLLTAEGAVKLADFGLSIDTRHEPANTRLGTQGYFAPEVLALPLKSSPFEGKSPEEAANRPSYDCKVDVWSAGVVCFEVLTGRAPFAAENVAQVLQAILHRQLVYPSHLSSDAVSFLSTALTRDPRTRPTVRELLQHHFITMHTSNNQQQQ